MITLVEARNYRSLEDLRQTLGPFQILVGPNASGKSTFLSALTFLSTFVRRGLEAAFEEQTQNPLDLFWERKPGAFEIAVEAKVPDNLLVAQTGQNTIRYRLKVAAEKSADLRPIVCAEALGWESPPAGPHPNLILRAASGNAAFWTDADKEPRYSFRFGDQMSALGNLPADEFQFPVGNWFRNLLQAGIRPLVLESGKLRQASPRGKNGFLRPDGSGLPWMVAELKDKHPEVFRNWIAHLRTALPDLDDIRVSHREDDGTAFLMVRYVGGLEVPSWVVSDGTLRLFALTIVAYGPWATGVYLVEEPENGIHPTNLQEVYDSLSSVYAGQVLVASHSPSLISLARPAEILCFKKSEDGATEIVRGDNHEYLKEWHGEVTLGSVFASGILG